MHRPDHEEYAEDIALEEARVEHLMTVQEIFEAGFHLGLSKAGLTSNAELAYKNWLLSRCA